MLSIAQLLAPRGKCTKHFSVISNWLATIMDKSVYIFEQSKRYRRPSVIEKKKNFVDRQTPFSVI